MIFLYYLIALLVIYALMPKPRTPPPGGPQAIQIPVPDASQPIPVIFGTCWITPTVAWYGDLSTRKVKTSSGK
jgi:hypothetical protein